MIKNKKILIIAAHPDDEVIGMGGSIKLFSENQNEVFVILLSSGVGSRNFERQSAESRKESARLALNKLGCSKIYFGDFPDNQFDTVGVLTIAKFIEAHVDRLQPEIVFTNYYQDLNVDHRITSEATLVAVRPRPDSSVANLYFYEVSSSTGWKFGSQTFEPNYYIDILNSNLSKQMALMEYQIEMNKFPSARSLQAIEYLNRYRGSTMGYTIAEAFEIGFIRETYE